MPALDETIELSEVAVLDGNAQALGTPVRALMARAGAGVADVVRQAVPEGPVLVLVGPGNNGGDGLVAAGELADQREVTVVCTHAEQKTHLAQEARDALPESAQLVQADALDDQALAGHVAGSACIVDALLGAGTRGTPRGEIGRIVQAVSGAEATVVAVDVPTGLGTELAIEPQITVALGAAKTVYDQGEVGDVHVVDIGIPEQAFTHTGPGEFTLYPRPGAHQHKGQGGFVLVLGGGPYTGAPALAAQAAMRTGADLSFVLTPEKAWPAVASFSPNIVARPLEGTDLDLQSPKNRVELNKWLGMADALVIGPGLGKMGPVAASVPIAVRRAVDLGVPIVADADALWALADHEIDLQGNAVITPHAKEFQVVTGKAVPDAEDVEGRVQVAQEAAASLQATVLLKGPVDVIADGQQAKRNATGTPSMSHGGTGDVLAGIVAGLLAKGMTPFDAARLGALISGKAGEVATREKSYGMLATDVVEAIPQVLKAYL